MEKKPISINIQLSDLVKHNKNIIWASLPKINHTILKSHDNSLSPTIHILLQELPSLNILK